MNGSPYVLDCSKRSAGSRPKRWVPRDWNYWKYVSNHEKSFARSHRSHPRLHGRKCKRGGTAFSRLYIKESFRPRRVLENISRKGCHRESMDDDLSSMPERNAD